ncbi:Centrosomal protein [Portunus trituberculatus]|uniref:Centrosomal protein n=1 Tax=Portunus trituberculatus TaxID=210409 RepID=A0A5B7F108_PORTR|nr:Centrosomal protein [Portunus trituberculatus]
MEPLKLGVRTHPPGLTLVYRSAAGKERYRVMPIRFLNKFGSVENVLKEVKDRHQPFLDKGSYLFLYRKWDPEVNLLSLVCC